MSPMFRSRTRTVRPAQQLGVALVRAQGLDEQPPPVCQDRRELPRALRLDLGRANRVPPAGPSPRRAAAIPPGPIRRSGTPNVTRTAAPTVTPAARARISSIGKAAPGQQPEPAPEVGRDPRTAARHATGTRPVMTRLPCRGRRVRPRPGRAATGARPTRRRASRRAGGPPRSAGSRLPGDGTGRRQEVFRRGGDRRAFHRRGRGPDGRMGRTAWLFRGPAALERGHGERG